MILWSSFNASIQNCENKCAFSDSLLHSTLKSIKKVVPGCVTDPVTQFLLVHPDSFWSLSKGAIYQSEVDDVADTVTGNRLFLSMDFMWNTVHTSSCSVCKRYRGHCRRKSSPSAPRPYWWSYRTDTSPRPCCNTTPSCDDVPARLISLL